MAVCHPYSYTYSYTLILPGAVRRHPCLRGSYSLSTLQIYTKCRSFANFARDFNPAAVAADDVAAEGETETDAGDVAVVRPA